MMSSEEPGPKAVFLVPYVKSRKLISQLFFIMNSRVHCRLTFTSAATKPEAAPSRDCEWLNDASENALSAPTNADPGKESRVHFKGSGPNLRDFIWSKESFACDDFLD